MAKSIFDERYRSLIRALKIARKGAYMKQQQVADALGKPQSYVAKVESLERRLDVIEFLDYARCIDWDPFPTLREVGYVAANEAE